MKRQYCVSPFKLAVSICTSLFSFLMAGVQIFLREWPAVILFFSVAVIFFAVAAANGSLIVLSPEGIQKKLAFLTLATLDWSDIKEVGVIGTKVFNGNHPSRTGTRYIYLSTAAFTDQERFRLALAWPPRNMIYLQYSKERLETVQLLWEGKIDTYNAGDVFF